MREFHTAKTVIFFRKQATRLSKIQSVHPPRLEIQKPNFVQEVFFDEGRLQIRGYRLKYWTKLKMKRNLSIMFEGWTLKVTRKMFLTRSLFAKFQAMNACTRHWRWTVKQELKEVPLWQSLMERIDERFSKKNTATIWVVSENNDAN